MSRAGGIPLLETLLAAIEADLRQAFQAELPRLAPPLAEILSYHLGWDSSAANAGKRVRPQLTLLCALGAGGDWRPALPAATAIELVHNFSLIHDDIEDQSLTRHGRPTLWAQWSVPLAINAGDALFALARLSAFRLVASGLPLEGTLEILQVIDRACLRLTAGQHFDLTFQSQPSVTEEDYLRMIEGKTAELLGAACEVGARSAGAAPEVVADYRAYGIHLGMTFQILDDILGIWGRPDETGKPAGEDLVQGKLSLPVILGLTRSESFRRSWGEGTAGKATPGVLAELLVECGARRESESAAERHTELALAALERTRAAAPAAGELQALAARLLRRER